jgi:hypothetical protein
MVTPNESSVLSTNGEAVSSSAKSKKSRKSGAGSAARGRTQNAAGKSPASRSASAPLETLFTQEPNPFEQPVPPYIWIDHPSQNEVLTWPQYNVRMGVGGADLVEISIDKSPWLPCRLTSGYWWYDWSDIAPGKHTLVARMRTSDNAWFKTPPRLLTRRSE